MGIGGSFAEGKVVDHFHLVPRLRMSGAIPSIPLVCLHGACGENCLFFFFVYLLIKDVSYRGTKSTELDSHPMYNSTIFTYFFRWIHVREIQFYTGIFYV